MLSSKTIALLTLAGSAIAAPWGGLFARDGDVATVTAYTTVFVNGPSPTAAVSVVAATPAPAAAVPTSAPAASSSNDGSYISIVNEYRSKMGLGSLAQDSTLEANDLKTLQDSPGSMVHELNPGSFAQVLAPGGPGDFFHCFVGGWLCEMPNLQGLDGICASESAGWSYDGTGHAEILSNAGYTKIGCANYDGIWGCDLA